MIEKAGRDIETLDDWRTYAGPKRPVQWKDGRSAKESARAWLRPAPAHPDFGELSSWHAEPEARVPFDSFGGEPSNIDVLLLGRDHSGPVVVAVEAKADETFGRTIGDTLARARDRLEANPRSKGVERVRGLARSILGVDGDDLSDVADLRYQLVTAIAAVLSAAKRESVERAVLVVHEFVTDATNDRRHASNAKDLADLVARLAGHDRFGLDALAGPLSVPGSSRRSTDVALYVGKVSRHLRSEP
jgi:hypothetical protein